jgi:hypothetical protein
MPERLFSEILRIDPLPVNLRGFRDDLKTREAEVTFGEFNPKRLNLCNATSADVAGQSNFFANRRFTI